MGSHHSQFHVNPTAPPHTISSPYPNPPNATPSSPSSPPAPSPSSADVKDDPPKLPPEAIELLQRDRPKVPETISENISMFFHSECPRRSLMISIAFSTLFALHDFSRYRNGYKMMNRFFVSNLIILPVQYIYCRYNDQEKRAFIKQQWSEACKRDDERRIAKNGLEQQKQVEHKEIQETELREIQNSEIRNVQS